MDTKVCWAVLLSAMDDGEHTAVLDHATNLLVALLAGMPVPDTTPTERDRLALMLAQLLDSIE